MREAAVRVIFDNVVQRFRIIQERPDTLREAFAKFRRRTSYHDFEALKHVSFQVAEGQMDGIIGRNGSGKSTILKIIAGVSGKYPLEWTPSRTVQARCNETRISDHRVRGIR